jgi:hypothetical protein
MKNRIKKRRIYDRHQVSYIRRTAEEQAWLDMVPVGREFGSKDYERLARLDAFADKAKAAAAGASVSIDKTLGFVAASNLRIEAMEKLDEIHPGEILLKEFIVSRAESRQNNLLPAWACPIGVCALWYKGLNLLQKKLRSASGNSSRWSPAFGTICRLTTIGGGHLGGGLFYALHQNEAAPAHSQHSDNRLLATSNF